MRALLLLPFLPLPLWADDFIAPAPVASATVYAGGALMRRTDSLSLPAGTHRILVPSPAQNPQVTMSGDLRILGTSILRNQISDPVQGYLPSQSAARAVVEAAEAVLADRTAALEAAQTAIPAIEAQLTFLRSATAAGLTTLDPATLSETATLLGDRLSVLNADLLDKQQSLTPLREAVTDARKTLSQAQADLARLSPPEGPVTMLAIDVAVASDTEATLQLDSITQANWSPLYDLYLTTGGSASVRVNRKVQVRQFSGLPWEGVDLSLSTANLRIDPAPSEAFPDHVRLMEPMPKVNQRLLATSSDMMRAPEMAPMAMEMAESAEFSATTLPGGLSVRYDYPEQVTLLSGMDALILNLDTLDLPSETFVRAVPRRDQSAFLMATVTNPLSEPLLEGQARLYRDTVFIGENRMPLIVAGADAEMPFGALEQIRLSYTPLTNDTGDRGLISTSNTRTQTMEFSVENLMDSPQTVQTLFALPFSEQEDLEISVRARPQPSQTDWDKRRNVGLWDFDLASGATQTVSVDVQMRWPEGRDIDWQP